MLANIGCEQIDERGEVTIHGVRLMLSRRGIDWLNCEANAMTEKLETAVTVHGDGE